MYVEQRDDLMRAVADRMQDRMIVTSDGCHEYTGAVNRQGMGIVCVRTAESGRWQRNERAHRVAWIVRHGLIPDGSILRHVCGNTACCNVDHLTMHRSAT